MEKKLFHYWYLCSLFEHFFLTFCWQSGLFNIFYSDKKNYTKINTQANIPAKNANPKVPLSSVCSTKTNLSSDDSK